jgi:hypothetical protein
VLPHIPGHRHNVAMFGRGAARRAGSQNGFNSTRASFLRTAHPRHDFLAGYHDRRSQRFAFLLPSRCLGRDRTPSTGHCQPGPPCPSCRRLALVPRLAVHEWGKVRAPAVRRRWLVAITALVEARLPDRRSLIRAATIRGEAERQQDTRRGAFTGSKLRNSTITGNQVNESKLGKVPSGRSGRSPPRTTSTTTTNAANSSQLSRQARFRQSPGGRGTRTTDSNKLGGRLPWPFERFGRIRHVDGLRRPGDRLTRFPRAATGDNNVSFPAGYLLTRKPGGGCHFPFPADICARASARSVREHRHPSCSSSDGSGSINVRHHQRRGTAGGLRVRIRGVFVAVDPPRR